LTPHAVAGGFEDSPACCLGSFLEFLKMRLCQFWLFQLEVETCWEKMNLSNAGAEH
jgi:hypothetical protein